MLRRILGRLATDLSPALTRDAIQSAMRKVANWQAAARILETPSQDWTFATAYLGMLAASSTLKDPLYHDIVLKATQNSDWSLGPRQVHADDQAIGQVYLEPYREHPQAKRIAPLRDPGEWIQHQRTHHRQRAGRRE